MDLNSETVLAFNEDKQAAIVGWAIRDKAFGMQCQRSVKQTWFSSAHMGKVYKIVFELGEQLGRIPSAAEIMHSRPWMQEEAKTQEMMKKALEKAAKMTDRYGLDLLRAELTPWLHSVIFYQSFNKAQDLFNAQKPQDAWKTIEDGLLLRQTSTFEEGLHQGFMRSTERLKNERELREAESAKIVGYGVTFLDEALGGINQSDVIVLGAKTGAGKTQLATSVTLFNVTAGKRVHYFALEAEDMEIERRVKYALLSDCFYEEHPDGTTEIDISYRNWRMNRLGKFLDKYEGRVQKLLDEKLHTLNTLYRNSGNFDLKALEKSLLKIVYETDLIVLDHLHYIDTGDDENADYKQVIKTVRDVALKYKVPIIVIAHLRKNQVFKNPPIVSGIEDFHGTSNVPKVATACIMLGRKPYTKPKDTDDVFGRAMISYDDAKNRHLSPTYMQVVKSRLDGEVTRYTALAFFNRRKGNYSKHYHLGRLHSGDTEWEPLEKEDRPLWAVSAMDVPKPKDEPGQNENNLPDDPTQQ